MYIETYKSANYKHLREEKCNFDQINSKITEESKDDNCVLNKDKASHSQAVINCRSIQNPTPEAVMHFANKEDNVIVNEVNNLISNHQLIMSNKEWAGVTPSFESTQQMKVSAHINQRKQILDSRRNKHKISNLSNIKNAACSGRVWTTNSSSVSKIVHQKIRSNSRISSNK